MRIALLTDGLFPLVIGGMQRHSAHLLKYLALNNLMVVVYHVNPDKKSLNQLDLSPQELKNIEFIEIPKSTKFRFPGHYVYEEYLFSKAVYKEFIKRPPPDIVYCQGFTGWYLNSISRSQKFRRIVNFHGLEMYQRAASLRSKLEQYLLRWAVKKNILRSEYVISNGSNQTRILKNIGVKEDRIIISPIAIEKNWIRTADIKINSPRKFLFIGRFERRRGIEELHKALKLLLNHREDFEFHFVCPIPDEMKINHSSITYWGRVNDEKLKELLADCDILVNPSFAEGMSYVILEAMASGLSVIASDVGAISLSVNNKNGWLIEPGNVDVLKNKMIEAIELEERALVVKKNYARDTVKNNFVWDLVIQDLILKMKSLI